jgi:hypothetical protein
MAIRNIPCATPVFGLTSTKSLLHCLGQNIVCLKERIVQEFLIEIKISRVEMMLRMKTLEGTL